MASTDEQKEKHESDTPGTGDINNPEAEIARSNGETEQKNAAGKDKKPKATGKPGIPPIPSRIVMLFGIILYLSLRVLVLILLHDYAEAFFTAIDTPCYLAFGWFLYLHHYEIR